MSDFENLITTCIVLWQNVFSVPNKRLTREYYKLGSACMIFKLEGEVWKVRKDTAKLLLENRDTV